MSFAERHNKRGNTFDIDTTGFGYYNLDSLDPDDVVTVRGLFINTKRTRRKKWDSPVLIADNCFFNLPTYMTAEIEEILASPEEVQEIKAGKVGFRRRDYTYKDADTQEEVNGVGIEWVDL